jgi:hypothetical protein
MADGITVDRSRTNGRVFLQKMLGFLHHKSNNLFFDTARRSTS